jgi:hypothetical protein
MLAAIPDVQASAQYAMRAAPRMLAASLRARSELHDRPARPIVRLRCPAD